MPASLSTQRFPSKIMDVKDFVVSLAIKEKTDVSKVPCHTTPTMTSPKKKRRRNPNSSPTPGHRH
jgi:hypothetical protein